MTEMDRSGFPELDRVLELVRHTRELLDGHVDAGTLPEGGADYLTSTTLTHLEGVQSGFTGWLRSDAADPAELRWILRRAAAFRVHPAISTADQTAATAEIEAERIAAARIGRAMPRLRGAEGWDLAALAHARVVLAWIPRVPEDKVRFRAGRRTYADIASPRTPAELADRIDEIERLLWRIVTGRQPKPADPAFRRTYGFFDTADTLGLGAFRDAA
jgi:hypothetical protein